jgi:hydroxymethylpyrimidine pyrophosphatase-like HAD family hydrolase
LGIGQSEIIAFGDDVNDIDLLEFCEISVAMGNAVVEVKEMADYICDTNENDGVAQWIEKYVL